MITNNIPAGIYIVQLVTNNASKTYKFRAAD
ncbi:T9SS type A sorting domain-containing protein [Bacteroides mediterraneensis]|nr:T9SS type A sorting domain-containing protein [Bacteroides mediterraneensis]